jgi:hypothetical protein
MLNSASNLYVQQNIKFRCNQYIILYINSLGFPVCLWCDVLLHNHFLCFYCGTDHREKHFRLKLAPPGNPFDFYTTVRSFVRSSVTGRSDPLTVFAMPIMQPPINESQKPILLRIYFFIYLFLDLFFRKNLRLRICFFFYLVLDFGFFFSDFLFGFFSPSFKLTKMKKQNKK